MLLGPSCLIGKRRPSARGLSDRLIPQGVVTEVPIFRAIERFRDICLRVSLRARRRVRRISRAVTPAKKRNVLFLHNSYYHFYYLARALRRRGWDAIVVSLEDLNGPNARYYHAEDVNLFA